ncbi:MAG: PmoA family protein [Pirellulales bacterium]|nr:PmoA family protein [Pirellulales bacterium]
MNTRFTTIALLAVFVLLATVTALPATEKPPVLSVPAIDDTLNIAVPLPPAEKDGLAYLGDHNDPAKAWMLVEIDHPDVSVPVDFYTAVTDEGLPELNRLRLTANIPPRAGAKDKRRFKLVSTPVTPEYDIKKKFTFLWKFDKASCALAESGRPVLVYNFGMITGEKVPKKDRRRQQAAFIHPVYGLSGEVLTDSFPRDHYHHHGIFWTWPHVGIDGKDYDLWTSRGIRTRYVRLLHKSPGRTSAALGMENGWFVGQQKVMIERVGIRVHASTDEAQVLDLEFTWIPVDRPITLRGAENKSYGGLTMRFAVPRKQKGTITVPSGVTKRDLSNTRLPWADLTYAFPGAPTASGAALMVRPDHPDFPPTWLTRHYGPQCIGYPGVDGKTFPEGKPFSLNYRIWIHKTPADLARLKKAYAAYEAAQKAAWE